MNFSYREVTGVQDIYQAYCLFRDEKGLAFLESALQEEKLGRYSFLGLHPYHQLHGSKERYVFDGAMYVGSLFDKLRELLALYQLSERGMDLAVPFPAGCIGYISYDFATENCSAEGKLPASWFVFYDNLLIFDHLESKLYISACGMLAPAELSLDDLERQLACAVPKTFSRPASSAAKATANFSREEYMAAVEKLRLYIEAGDVYIANMTQTLTAHSAKTSARIYEDLRRINPAPFAARLEFEGLSILSSSPERFLQVVAGEARTRPIKGTRPRGRTKAEDEENRQALLDSEKDKSELLMIVDLERNDLSRVCQPHTIKVPELFSLEAYSTVFHLVAEVTGKLRPGISATECLEHCFPGGSITGAPKRRAMEIIEELERGERGLYTGCIGYFSLNGNADFNIAIRTIVKQGEKLSIGVGGGITWESEASEEYQETLDKAKALLQVI